MSGRRCPNKKQSILLKRNAAKQPCAELALILKVVLDTCILKLATLPNEDNPAALILALAWAELIACWASPAILEEYSIVLASEPELLAMVQQRFAIVYPLLQLDLIKHEPDNRFLECALAVEAEYLITVNTARGHFDKSVYGSSRVTTPGTFLKIPEVRRLF
jgi:predicted nucleic acid-binding protein